MKKIKLRLIPFKEENGKLHLRPMADEFVIDRPSNFRTGALVIEVKPSDFKIETVWDEEH